MKLLLDTHVLLWALLEPQKLSPALRNALEDSDTTLLVSVARAAGLWEVPPRDPFDRLLAAQAKADQLVLASTDKAFAQFDGVLVFG